MPSGVRRPPPPLPGTRLAPRSGTRGLSGRRNERTTMKHPLSTLLLALATAPAGAAGPCDPSASFAYDLPAVGRPELGKPFTSCYGVQVERITDHERER